MAYFSQNKQIVLTCDANKSGLRAAIKQDENVIIAYMYASKNVNKSTTKLEVEKNALRVYLYVQNFTHTCMADQLQLKQITSHFRKYSGNPLYQAPPRLLKILLHYKSTTLKFNINLERKCLYPIF